MVAIPELVRASRLRIKMEHKRVASEADEKRLRALLLAAVAKGATYAQIQAEVGLSERMVRGRLRQARDETTDPALRSFRPARGGVSLGEYPCPTCRPKGKRSFPSAQALAMHRVKMHDYRKATA